MVNGSIVERVARNSSTPEMVRGPGSGVLRLMCAWQIAAD
jgi:hypothetical protein